METIILYLKETTKKDLKQIALDKNIKVNTLINNAIKEYIEK